MKEFKTFSFTLVGIGLGLLLYHFFFRKAPQYEINGQDVSWIFDKAKSKVDVDRNYVFATMTGGSPISVLGEVNSADAIDAVKYFKTYSDTCTSFTKSRTYCVGYSIRELETYFANVRKFTTIDSFRVYLGLYPNTAAVDKADRLTGHLIAVGTDKLEKYDDATPGYKVINLGTLCPTACPPSGAVDPNSLYHRAGCPQ